MSKIRTHHNYGGKPCYHRWDEHINDYWTWENIQVLRCPEVSDGC